MDRPLTDYEIGLAEMGLVVNQETNTVQHDPKKAEELLEAEEIRKAGQDVVE